MHLTSDMRLQVQAGLQEKKISPDKVTSKVKMKCFADMRLMISIITSAFSCLFSQPEHVCGHDHHGRLMKGVFYQHSAYAFCLIPEMLCNLEPMLSNNFSATDTVVYGLRRLSQGGLCGTGWLSCFTSLLACRH